MTLYLLPGHHFSCSNIEIHLKFTELPYFEPCGSYFRVSFPYSSISGTSVELSTVPSSFAFAHGTQILVLTVVFRGQLPSTVRLASS